MALLFHSSLAARVSPSSIVCPLGGGSYNQMKLHRHLQVSHMQSRPHTWSPRCLAPALLFDLSSGVASPLLSFFGAPREKGTMYAETVAWRGGKAALPPGPFSPSVTGETGRSAQANACGILRQKRTYEVK